MKQLIILEYTKSRGFRWFVVSKIIQCEFKFFSDVSLECFDVGPEYFDVSPEYFDVSPEYFDASPEYFDVDLE